LPHPLPFRKEIARYICFFPILFQVHGYCQVTCARHLFDARGAPRIVMTRQEIVLGNPQGSGSSGPTGYVRCDAVVMDPRGLPGSTAGGADCKLEAVAVCCTRHGSGNGGYQPPADPSPPNAPLCPSPRQYVPSGGTCPCLTSSTQLQPYNTPCGNTAFPANTCSPIG
jgi:hypothetical protein